MSSKIAPSTITNLFTLTVLTVWLLHQSHRTYAQTSSDVITPPKLIRFVEASYPESARASGREAAVLLRLTIDTAGKVTQAEVVKSAGGEFDDAAKRAALQFEFEPARRNEKPIASRISYRYIFEFKPPPAPQPPLTDTTPKKAAEKTNAETVSTEAAYGATARVDPAPREVTRRTIDSTELTRIPGTRGDALRAVELLPGVGRPPFSLGLLLVRGSSPQDSQVFYEGVPIPLPYHFGGITSVVNPRLLDHIDFYPGNYSVRYGRKVGGILEVFGRDVGDHGFHGVLDINLIDGSVLAELPIGKKGGVAIAARRSYIDLFFDALAPQNVFDTLVAPVYYDYQLGGWYNITPRDRIRISIYGSSDKLRLFLRPSDLDPILRGNFDLSTSFHRFQVSWRRRFSPSVEQDIEASIGTNDLLIGAGASQRLHIESVPITVRTEWRARVSPRVRLTGGMDMQITPTDVNYVGPQPRQSEGDPGGGPGGQDPLSTQTIVTRRTNITAYRPAVYAESSVSPINNLTFIMGLRLDWFDDIRRWSFDPRFVIRYTLSDKTILKAGMGMFSQPPEFQESDAAVGNPNLKPIRALHTSAGIEHNVNKGLQLSLEGFYKRLSDRVVAVSGGTAPYFTNNGVGNIYGLEFMGRLRTKESFFGYLSYTLMRSERRDGNGPWRLFDFDQTHILSAAAVYQLGRGWEVGATFRVVSGNPYTPITGSVYNATADLYQPIYGTINSARNPMFNRLDVRIQKQWTFNSWKLAVYLDVQNAYNSKNREGVSYSYDYRQSSDVRGLPIIPALGVRGEL